jgi:hypothetical protein
LHLLVAQVRIGGVDELAQFVELDNFFIFLLEFKTLSFFLVYNNLRLLQNRELF